MSTRYSKTKQFPGAIDYGYEGTDVPDDIEVPPCSIEDVDRAVFELFNKEMPLLYELRKQTTRIPVIFATGERFAVLRRKRPLRDKAGALILPLISIIRSGIEQDPSKGMTGGQTQPMVVKRKLSKKDPNYQALINKMGLQNQSDFATRNHSAGTSVSGAVTGSLPGTISSRRQGGPKGLAAMTGRLLTPDLTNNIFEIITLPPVKYFQANYEITFWAQYTQQMNNMLTAVMASSQWYPGRTFKIETTKGYWFVAYVDAAMTPANNYDDFTDDERLVRYSFTMSVPAYIVAPEFPGAPPPLRRTYSSPEISFDVVAPGGHPTGPAAGMVPSGDPSAYLLADLTNLDDPQIAAAMGSDPSAAALAAANPSATGGAQLAGGPQFFEKVSVNIGGQQAGPQPTSVLRMVTDPFTGKTRETLVKITTSNQRKGETVYSEGLSIDLGMLNE
jgi:hypothetical protein